MTLVPEYLRTGDEEALNLSEYGPALGRRFRALKLWAVLRCYGREGLQARIREAVRLAELFEGWVRESPRWEVVAPRPFSVVCFRREGSDEENADLLERVNASGEAFLSHTALMAVTFCGSRSGTHARPRKTCGGLGISYGGRLDDHRNDKRDRRTRDRGGVRRGLRADGALRERVLSVRRRPEGDGPWRARGEDDGGGR